MQEKETKSVEIIDKELYIDEPCFVSFFYGELGWFLSAFQAHLRYLKHEVYKDLPFLLFTELDYHVFVEDFVSYTVELPEWFYEFGLERDCYEAPIPNSPPGSLTPPKVYSRLIEYFRKFYNQSKAVEMFPPRGCNAFIRYSPQLFRKFVKPRIETERDIICVMPRGRDRAAHRNVPSYVWKEVVDDLRKYFTIVLCGTPNGSFLSGYNAENVINLIDYNGNDKMDLIVQFLNSAICSVSSQSGLTHVSLLCDCPSYIIGHEMERHAKFENRFNTPVSFRFVSDYRAIDSQTILSDIAEMLDLLRKSEDEKINKFDTILDESISNLDSLIDGVNNG